MSPMQLSDLLRDWPALERHEVERLLAHAMGVARSSLPGADIGESAVAAFTELARRRLAGEPLQYIEGTVRFGPLELVADRRALIPRPETEQLWERVVERVDDPAIVVDLCTGSGNLALACKCRWPEARVLATDISPDALALAGENAERTNLAIELKLGDLFDPLPHTLRNSVDLITANPPYLAQDELATLPAEVVDHEPHSALVSGQVGDETLARIARDAPRWLAPGGLLACEISEFQEDKAAVLFTELDGAVERDLAGKPRFVFARNEMVGATLDVLEAVRRGEVVGLVTDTVYGVGCDVYSRLAVNQLFAIKQRPADKPVPVLVADLDQAREIAVIDQRTERHIGDRWPGPVTFVVHRRPGLPDWIGDPVADSVALRVPDHPRLLSLLRRTGPLAATSANRSGEPAVLDHVAARRLFGRAVAAYLPGQAAGGVASEVVDLTSGRPQVLRRGAGG